jgi:hypothetical protein
LEKQQVIANEKISKLVQLGTNLVENIIEPAAKKGDVGAIQALGECYQHGLGGKRKDEKQAIEYYERGVSANSPASQCSLGSLLVERQNDQEAKKRGVELLKTASVTLPAAQHKLAQCRWLGGTTFAYQSVDLWKKAASSGFAPSQYQLGDQYERGDGVDKDMKQAEQWYLKAAEAGEVKAQLALGRIYENDEKLKDANKAVEWYAKAYYNGEAQKSASLLWRIFDPDRKLEIADLDTTLEWVFRSRQSTNIGYVLERKLAGLTASMKALFRASIHDDNDTDGTAFFNLATECSQNFNWCSFVVLPLLGLLTANSTTHISFPTTTQTN